MRPRIVLTMIVKNETKVIERCINSIRPVIDAWCIVDTGSTDGTQDLIRRTLADLPGELHEIPWRDFAYNRTTALELARPLGEYSLMIDADVQCVVHAGVDLGAFTASLTADVYGVMLDDRAIEYQRPQLTSTRVPFSYRGVLHEFLVVPPDATNGGIVDAFHFLSNFDGARSQNPNKWHDDVRILEQALAAGVEADIAPRYTYYLGQSLFAAGRLRDAGEIYRRRAEMGGWAEEVYLSWYASGQIRHRLGDDIDLVLADLMRANDALPSRAEAACRAASVARLAGRMPTAYLFARRAADIERPAVSLFLEPDVYEWRALYELSIAAYYVGRTQEGLDASYRLLTEGKVPDTERESVRENLRFYE